MNRHELARSWLARHWPAFGPVLIIGFAWAAALLVGVSWIHRCNEDIRAAHEYPCSADGRRDQYEKWLRICLSSTNRPAVECEALAKRHVSEDGKCPPR